MSSYLALLRENSNYRRLWWGAVISLFGDWFNLIASASLVANLTSAGTAVSYLFLARFLPLFFFTPLAGVLADRYDRRKILIVADLARAATVLCFLLVRRPEDLWLLYGLTVLQFALSALFTPARSAVIANVVAPQDLVTANALDSVTWSTMLALGALVGGLVAAAFGIATAFVIDAASFLLSAWFIGGIRRPTAGDRGRRTEDGAVTNVLRQDRAGWLDFVDGLRYLRGEPFILAMAMVKGAGSLAWGAVNVLEITFAERIFPIGSGATGTLGILYAISGLGTGLGPLLLRRWLGDAPFRLRWAIGVGFLMLAAGIFGVSQSPSLPWLGFSTLVRTIGSGTVWVFSAALLQMVVPDRVRGRVFAFEFAFLTLTQSLSTFWAGFAQDRLALDVRQVALVMSGVALVGGGLWFTLHWRGRWPLIVRPSRHE
ncbi:MAG: MFS transporter [Chloroflexota bacterium]